MNAKRRNKLTFFPAAPWQWSGNQAFAERGYTVRQVPSTCLTLIYRPEELPNWQFSSSKLVNQPIAAPGFSRVRIFDNSSWNTWDPTFTLPLLSSSLFPGSSLFFADVCLASEIRPGQNRNEIRLGRGTHRLLFIPPTGKRIVLFSFSFYRKKLLGIVCFDSGRDTWQVFVGRRDSCSLAVTQLRVTASATMYPIDSLNSTGSCNNSDDDARSLVHRAALRSIVRRKRDRSETRDR